jgi:hypothetical protein
VTGIRTFSLIPAQIPRRNFPVNKVTPEQEQEILNSSPKGAFVLLFAYGVSTLVVWLLFYFARYMALGPAS